MIESKYAVRMNGDQRDNHNALCSLKTSFLLLDKANASTALAVINKVITTTVIRPLDDPT